MKIIYSKKAKKFLDKQDLASRNRIVKAIEKLPIGDVKKLHGLNGYRLRVGNFRILFDHDGNIIDIIDIDNRGQIYK
jgi:mRNA interferase RelE/StbE